MLQVSRTQVPENWLSCTLKSEAVPENDAVIKLDHSRYSSQTITKDIYSEFLTWCSMFDTTQLLLESRPTSQQRDQTPAEAYMTQFQMPPSYIDSELEAASTPTDMMKEWDSEAFLDPTTRAIGFDLSCLEGLDDLVVYSPIKAFSELLWGDAVRPTFPADQLDVNSPYYNSPFPVPTHTRSCRPASRSPLVGWSSDSDTDSDECETDQDEEQYDPPIAGSLPTRGLSSYNLSDGRKQHFTMDEQPPTSLVSYAPNFPSSSYKNAIGDFPKAADGKGRSIPNRFATFCANIPTKVSFGRSAASQQNVLFESSF